MNTVSRNLFYIIALLLFAIAARSETVYVSDELRVGLHSENDLASPIVKILSTGAQLEVLKQEDNLSYVKDPENIKGWIDNSYLKKEITTIARLKSALNKNITLEKQISQLQKELKTLKTDPPQNNQALSALEKEHKQLQQQYQSAQLKVKELQAQLEQKRKQTGQGDIAQLQQEKAQLEAQLASLMDNKLGIRSNHPAGLATANDQGKGRSFYYALMAILGLGAGIFLMDYLNRRRHGGFRV